jgi:hypothetical protein
MPDPGNTSPTPNAASSAPVGGSAPASAATTPAEPTWKRLIPRSSRRAKVDARRLAIESGATFARAIACDRAAGRIQVVGVCDESFPAGGERANPREILGVTRVPCVIALAREDALLGRVELPTDDEAELRSMARMALVRDYSVEGVETLSDFQRSSTAGGATSVVVAAATRLRIDEAAGRAASPVARVSLRALGMLALIRASDTMQQGATLAVDATREGLECTLTRDGELLHSRGSAIAPGTPEQQAAAILIDFRRLIASLRSSTAAGEAPLALDRIVITADKSVAAILAPQMSAIAGCSAVRLDSHPRVGFASPDVRDQVCASCLPLAGLLLEDDAAVEPTGDAIDLLHPTPLIDVAARARQRILMVAGIMIVAGFAGWTVGARAWTQLEDRHDDLLAKAQKASPVRLRYRRDEFKLKHLEAYRALAPDWLSHLDTLRRFAPDPTSVVLDGFSAQLDGTEIDWVDSGKSTANPDLRFTMQAKPELRFVLDGEAKDRTTADSLRDALVKEKGYTVASTGADARGGRRLPYPFAYTLRTADLEPKQPGAAADGASAPTAAPKPEGGS